MAISHFAGENEAARDSKPAGCAPGSKPNAASFFRQFHRSVAAAVKTGGARSSWQTWGLSSTSLTNWSDPRVLNLEMIWNNFERPLVPYKVWTVQNYTDVILGFWGCTLLEQQRGRKIVPLSSFLYQSFESKQSKSHEFAHKVFQGFMV